MMRGGKRPNSGRKSKGEDIKLLEGLDKYIDQSLVLEKLKELIEKGNLRAIQLYLQYRYGKPNDFMANEEKEMVIRVVYVPHDTIPD